jgi:parallel beta-helix repeat protein
MNKKITIAVVVLAIAVLLALFYFTFNSRTGNVVNLDTGLTYKGIQEAIDANDTKDGHTLLIYPGTYHENIHVNKRLTIEGQYRDEVIVEAGNTSVIIILVEADYSTIANLTVQSSTFGIWCRNVKGCIVSGNMVINCTTGIRLDSYDLNKPSESGCVVKGNEVLNGTLRGIHLYGAYNNTVIDNLVQGTHGASGAYAAIDVELSTNNTLVHNQLKNNDCGVWLNVGAFNTTIYRNNFISNSLQVSLRYNEGGSASWDSGSPPRGNHWSDYTGTDADRDGIGDTPYLIGEKDLDMYPLMSATAFP